MQQTNKKNNGRKAYGLLLVKCYDNKIVKLPSCFSIFHVSTTTKKLSLAGGNSFAYYFIVKQNKN